MKRLRAHVRTRSLVLVLALSCVFAAGGGVATRLPAQAQLASTIDIRIVPPESPSGAGGSLTAGGLLTQVVVFNTGSAPLTNVQVVVRVPNAPALVQNVSENGAPLGVIDSRTGLWYHTISSLAENRSFTFVVNWWNPCVGKWPFAVRANDRRVSTSFQFTGASVAGCGPDETSAPASATYFELPWPPTPTPTTVVSSSVAIPTTVGTATPITAPPPAPIPTVVGSSVTPTPTTPPTPSTAAPVITKPPVPTSRKPTTTKKPPTTLEIVCKTVGGRRYCGPKSSALKPGQAKPKEVPVTTIKKKKK
jgi:hypothetical protein